MRSQLGWGLIAALAVSSAAVGQTWVDGPPPKHRLVHRNLIAARVNALGLFYEGRFMYRLRLYKNEKVALRDNFLGVGITPQLSPAFVRVGPYLEFAPATFLTLWGSFTFVQYFGSFNLFQSFASARSDFSDTAIRELPKDPATKNYLGNGSELTLGADVQLKVASIVLRSRTRLVRGMYNVREGDRAYYDQMYDSLSPNFGWLFTNDVDVLWQGLENKLVLGARYTGTVPLYEPRHFAAGEATDNPNAMHRVGPFFGYTFKTKDGTAFNNPTVFALVQWWLMHRFRTGADTPTALPMFGLGFQFTGDLWHSKPD